MIPPCDPATGNLPPGIHPARWEEVVVRYGITVWRQELLVRLRRALDALAAAGCRQVYLDGSFVTTKVDPALDVAWDSRGVDIARLRATAPALFDTAPPRQEQHNQFGGDYFPAALVVDRRSQAFLDFFQRDRRTGRAKGIVAVQLEDEA
jgi:hypothetical protein